MKAKALRVALVVALSSFIPICASAFTMEPIMASLAPSGAGKVVTFRVKNDGADRVAIRCKVLSRALSPEGTELNAPAGELFKIYPASFVAEPGTTVSVKVQWLGPSVLDIEKSYRFVAEQVPIDAAEAKSGASSLRILFRYVASLYVTEPGFSPALEARVVGGLGPNGKKGYWVEVGNSGTKHVVALKASVEFLRGQNGDVIRFSGSELGDASDSNYLPGSSRKVFVPRPDAETGEEYAARIEYESAY